VSDVAGPTEAIRRTLRFSEDPRVARTREAIAAAVRELSLAGDEITVASIVRASGISRASFYSHYSGLDQLALALTRDAFLSIAEAWAADEHEPLDAMRAAQRRLVAYFSENRWFYRAVAAMPVSKDGYLAAVRMMAAVIEQAIAPYPEAAPVEATARYVAGAAYGLIDAWLTEEIELTDDQLVERLVSMLPPWFSGAK